MAMDDAALPLPAAALPHSDSDHPEQQSGHIIEVINQFINQTYQLLFFMSILALTMDKIKIGRVQISPLSSFFET